MEREPPVTTLGDLVERTRSRWLEPTSRHTVNKLNGVFTTAATTLTLTYAQALDRGNDLGVEQEIVHVWSYNSGTKVATVERAFRGTTAAQHADLSLVDVDPRYSRFDVLGALKDEIAGWPTNLYQIVATQTTVARGQTTVNLPAVLDGCLGLVDARYNNHPLTVVVTGSTDATTYDRWPRMPYARLAKQMPVAGFASGTALMTGRLFEESTTLNLVAAMPFDLSTFTEATTIDTVGLSGSMTDLACMGAAVRMMLGGEAGRLDRTAQGEPRKAQEVPPGAAMSAAYGLQRNYTNRLRSEVQRLQADWPVRIR